MRLKALIQIRPRSSVRSAAAGITVLMSLVGVLIIAMIGTCIETARYTACAGQGCEALRVGTDALLTEYSKPLYDNYGLFFIEDTGTPFEQVISRYVGESMKNTPGFMDFLKGEMTSLEITEKTYVGDDEAKPLAEEIKEYMKRFVTGDELSKLLGKVGRLSDTEATAESIEKTVDEEKEDTKLDNRILRLMYLVDGVRISKNGSIKCDTYFAKKYATVKDYTGADFGIRESVVWKSVKKQINKNPTTFKDIGPKFLSGVKKVREKTEEAIREGERLKKDYATGKHSDMAARVIAGLPSLSGNLRVLKETEKLITSSDPADQKREKLVKLWKDYDTDSLSFDYSGAGTAKGDDASPLDALGGAIGDGILSLVCKNPDKLSKKGIKNPDKYAKYYKESPNKKDDYTSRVKKLASDEKVELGGTLGSIAEYGLEEFMLDSYITKMFPSYTEKITKKDKDGNKWKHSLDYGWEYVVAGEKSDKANLESVISRILVLRTVTNFTAIIADPVKRAEAFTAAVAVVGFTGLTFLIHFTQTLFIAAWAFAESLCDVAAILMKKDVPLIKTSAQVKTSFFEIFLLTNSSIRSRAKRYLPEKPLSFGYKEYVIMFLMMTSGKTRRYRIMDLIENDMKKNGYEGFSFGKCVFEMETEAEFSFPSKFFHLPGIAQILNRDLSGYNYNCRIKAGYI